MEEETSVVGSFVHVRLSRFSPCVVHRMPVFFLFERKKKEEKKRSKSEDLQTLASPLHIPFCKPFPTWLFFLIDFLELGPIMVTATWISWSLVAYICVCRYWYMRIFVYFSLETEEAIE
jgi:hypothetical protein